MVRASPRAGKHINTMGKKSSRPSSSRHKGQVEKLKATSSHQQSQRSFQLDITSSFTNVCCASTPSSHKYNQMATSQKKGTMGHLSMTSSAARRGAAFPRSGAKRSFRPSSHNGSTSDTSEPRTLQAPTEPKARTQPPGCLRRTRGALAPSVRVAVGGALLRSLFPDLRLRLRLLGIDGAPCPAPLSRRAGRDLLVLHARMTRMSLLSCTSGDGRFGRGRPE